MNYIFRLQIIYRLLEHLQDNRLGKRLLPKIPMPAVKENNDLVVVATRAEEFFKESEDDNTAPQGNIKE